MSGDLGDDWSQGYVTEIDYTMGFYAELAPSHLRFALLMQGIQPPAMDRPFAYLELGCGHGLTTNLLAAANPESRFFATDFNPAHIVNARALAEEAALGNVQFFEDSFEELRRRDLPDFDVIALHGIFSWVAPEVRRSIIQIIRERLKPNGIVYISYNALPGWGPMAPIRWLMHAYAGSIGGPINYKFAAALSLVERMNSNSTGYLKNNPRVSNNIDAMKKKPRTYLIHEYLDEHWQPFFHAEMVNNMNAAKIAFAASATLTENLSMLRWPPGLKEIADEISDPALKETVRDFGVGQQFRRDIFIRGKRKLSEFGRLEAYQQTAFALVKPREKCELSLNGPAGRMKLEQEQHGLILDMLAERPALFASLQQRMESSNIRPGRLMTVINTLCAAGYVKPCRIAGSDERSDAVTRAFNVAILRRALRGEYVEWVASPLVGSGIRLSLTEQMLITALSRQADDPAESAAASIEAIGRYPKKDGKPEDRSEFLARLGTSLEQLRSETIPRLLNLGVLK